LRSSSTGLSHLNLGIPTRRLPSGFCRVSFLQVSSPCILKRCPSHPDFPNFITLAMSTSL
jgi:hypothetical protein